MFKTIYAQHPRPRGTAAGRGVAFARRVLPGVSGTDHTSRSPAHPAGISQTEPPPPRCFLSLFHRCRVGNLNLEGECGWGDARSCYTHRRSGAAAAALTRLHYARKARARAQQQHRRRVRGRAKGSGGALWPVVLRQLPLPRPRPRTAAAQKWLDTPSAARPPGGGRAAAACGPCGHVLSRFPLPTPTSSSTARRAAAGRGRRLRVIESALAFASTSASAPVFPPQAWGPPSGDSSAGGSTHARVLRHRLRVIDGTARRAAATPRSR